MTLDRKLIEVEQEHLTTRLTVTVTAVVITTLIIAVAFYKIAANKAHYEYMMNQDPRIVLAEHFLEWETEEENEFRKFWLRCSSKENLVEYRRILLQSRLLRYNLLNSVKFDDEKNIMPTPIELPKNIQELETEAKRLEAW